MSEPFSEALEATALMQPLASGVGVALAVEVAVALAVPSGLSRGLSGASCRSGGGGLYIATLGNCAPR